jgi:CBS domain-containing protein
MSIEDILKAPVRVLPPDATCIEAARMMRDENIGCVVVAEDDRPLGIVTDRDLVLRVMAPGGEAEKFQLRDVMTSEPIFVSVDQSLEQVVAAMRDLAIRRVPAVDENGSLCGMVSLDDVLLCLVDQLGDLAEAVRAELAETAA